MSWQTVRIGDFLKRVKVPIEIHDHEVYKRVTVRIKHNGVSLRDKEIGKKIGTKKQFVLKAGQFIVSKIDARYGAFGIAPGEVNDAIITGNFWAYDVDKNKVDIDWFNNYTNSPEFYDLCERASSGITHRKYLDENFFLNHQIALPGVQEQLEIVESIEKARKSIHKVLDEVSHQLHVVGKLRQAFLKEAMQGKLVPQDDADEGSSILLEKVKAEKAKLIVEKKIKKEKPLPEIKREEIPFEIPNNWVWCRIGDIATNVEYGTSQKADLDSTNVPVLRMNNILYGKVVLEKLKYLKPNIKDLPRLFLRNNDILFNRTNSYDLVGKSGVFKGDDNTFTFASYLIRIQFLDLISPDFINYYINSVQCRESQIEPDIIQQNGQANYNGTKLKNVITPLPPLAEQKRIVEKLEKLMAFCDELEANIRESKRHAEALLQVALKEALEPKR